MIAVVSFFEILILDFTSTNFYYLWLLLNPTLMNLIVRILITAVLVVVIAHFMPGISVASFTTSIIVAVVLGLLNIFIKPILVLLTLPVTLITFGLFLLVINALMILFCSEIVGGFHVESFWTAVFFSIILSISQSIIYGFSNDKKS
jgi:putative membrane protein